MVASVVSEDGQALFSSEDTNTDAVSISRDAFPEWSPLLYPQSFSCLFFVLEKKWTDGIKNSGWKMDRIRKKKRSLEMDPEKHSLSWQVPYGDWGENNSWKSCLWTCVLLIDPFLYFSASLKVLNFWLRRSSHFLKVNGLSGHSL